MKFMFSINHFRQIITKVLSLCLELLFKKTIRTFKLSNHQTHTHTQARSWGFSSTMLMTQKCPPLMFKWIWFSGGRTKTNNLLWSSSFVRQMQWKCAPKLKQKAISSATYVSTKLRHFSSKPVLCHRFCENQHLLQRYRNKQRARPMASIELSIWNGKNNSRKA